MQSTIMLFCGMKSCIAYYYDEIEDSDTIKVKRVKFTHMHTARTGHRTFV